MEAKEKIESNQNSSRRSTHQAVNYKSVTGQKPNPPPLSAAGQLMDSEWSFGRVLISPAARLVTSADGMIWVLQRSRKMTAASDEWAERRGISVFARSPICQLRAYKSLFAREMSERLLGAIRSDGASDCMNNSTCSWRRRVAGRTPTLLISPGV